MIGSGYQRNLNYFLMEFIPTGCLLMFCKAEFQTNIYGYNGGRKVNLNLLLYFSSEPFKLPLDN
jgi:hypothetical protein